MAFDGTTILAVLSALLPGAVVAKERRWSTCSPERFQSLLLDNIQRISIDVTANRNLSTNGRNTTGGVSVVHDPLDVDLPTVDICLITLQYTHPGQQDLTNTNFTLHYRLTQKIGMHAF